MVYGIDLGEKFLTVPSDSPAQPSPQFVKAKREKHQVIPPASRNPRSRYSSSGW
jgi:hypothetical protein